MSHTAWATNIEPESFLDSVFGWTISIATPSVSSAACSLHHCRVKKQGLGREKHCTIQRVKNCLAVVRGQLKQNFLRRCSRKVCKGLGREKTKGSRIVSQWSAGNSNKTFCAGAQGKFAKTFAFTKNPIANWSNNWKLRAGKKAQIHTNNDHKVPQTKPRGNKAAKPMVGDRDFTGGHGLVPWPQESESIPMNSAIVAS